MTRDVFKYLKASRELLEAKAVDNNAKAREEAERLGGIPIPGSYGKYKDKNGKAAYLVWFNTSFLPK